MSNLLSLKLKQIEALKSRYPTIKEITKDSTYKIPLFGGNFIVISLPANFPNVPPVYFLESPDGQTITVKPPTEWSPMTSLAKITMDYIQHYSTNPPQFPQYSPPPSYFSTANTNTNNNNNNSNGNPIPPTQGQPPPPYKENTNKSPVNSIGSNNSSNNNSNNNVQKPAIPSIPSKFQELESKSKDELESILNSGEIEIVMFSLDEVTIMSDQRDQLKTKNDQLLVPVNPKKEKIQELKTHLEEQIQLYNQLKAETESKQKKKESIQKAISTSVLIEKLTEMAMDAETESDNIANDFLEGNIDLKEFKKQFKEKRNIYHSRLAKRDGLISGIGKEKNI